MSIKIVDDIYFHCPLVERDLSETECYDIQMVSHGYIKSGILDFELDKAKAEVLCTSCPFNQLSQSVFSMKESTSA